MSIRMISGFALRTMAAVIGCTLAGANVYATSKCYEWQASRGAGAQSVMSTWSATPQEALDQMPALCDASNAARAYCEGQTNCTIPNLNNGLYTCTNWRLVGGVTVWPNGFPKYTAEQTLSLDRIAAPPPIANGNTTYYIRNVTITSRTNPAGCGVYVTALPPTPAQCGPPCNGVGDPVNPATGAVYAAEGDVERADLSIQFKRFYDSIGVVGGTLGPSWRHSFTRSIKPKYSSSTHKPYAVNPDNSSLYTTEFAACTSGFAQIKARVSTWAGATATYANGVCTLAVGATTIGTLPILYQSQPTPAPGATLLIGFDATRDDGQLVSFTIQAGAIVAPAGMTLTLQQTGGGYTLRDASDTVEVYDGSGRLLSITNRAGVVQTMSYDSSSRLSTVTDSFGHQLTLTYDSQGRLATVTRQ